MIQIKSSYLEIMLHVLQSEFEVCEKSCIDPVLCLLIIKQFFVCFMSCCINSFLW